MGGIYENPNTPKPVYDPVGALKLLNEAGWYKNKGEKNFTIGYGHSSEDVKEGDILTAIVIHESLTDKKGQYIIKIINQKEIEIAVFNGIVHRTSKIWFYNNEK